MNRLRLLTTTALVALAACGGEKPAAETPAAAPENDAQRAARIALALRAVPEKTDSILASFGVTANQLEQLMYKVAQDSALSAEYGRLTDR